MGIKELRRRDFLKMLGVAVSGTALGGLDTVWAAPDTLIKEALRGPGIETFKNTICQLCPGGCGIRVRLIDGVPVHIDGNPMNPVNRGGICPHGAAGLDFLYHPDRLRSPMKRAGERGRWEEISWEDALREITDRLKLIRKGGSPEQLAFFVGAKRGLMYELISRFMTSFGSPNLLLLDENINGAEPFKMLFGWEHVPEYDIEHAKYVLSIGANFLEEGASPVRSIYVYGRMRENQAGGRARLVYVDPRHSLTAGSADLFLPIKLGTHGAFALGVAYVLIKERYYDEYFVKKHVHGFESWVDRRGIKHIGFKPFVLDNFYPEKVAQLTGVPSRRIVEVAREFGRTKPALAMIGQSALDTTNGLFNSLAVQSLNVLVGNVEKKGGLRFKRRVPFERFPKISLDKIARECLKKQSLAEDKTYKNPFGQNEVINFCDHLEAGDLYSVSTLFIYGSNPAFDHPYAKRIRRVLEKIPFIVSFSSMMDDTSEYAHMIIPDHAPMERWMDSEPAPGIKFAHAGVAQPIVEPFYDTRHTGDVLIGIARNMGGTVSKSISWDDFIHALRDKFYGIYTSGEGSVISGSFEESWAKYLKERGWQNLVYDSFEDFWKVLVERGGWWDPVDKEEPVGNVLGTHSGKVEVYSTRFAERVYEIASALGRNRSIEDTKRVLFEKWRLKEKGDEALLPHFEEPRFSGSEKKYPYYLLTFNVLSNRDGSGGFSPLLQEMFGYYQDVYWQSWVELNPETAHENHIREGDMVRVTSPEGELKAIAVFNEALEKDVVAVPFGMGHRSGGRYTKGIGVNPYEILSEESDYVWGRPSKAATRVMISKTGREKS